MWPGGHARLSGTRAKVGAMTNSNESITLLRGFLTRLKPFFHPEPPLTQTPLLNTFIMDFTELYKHNAALVAFSPGAQFILTAIQDRLVVRRADSFQINRTWQFTLPADSYAQQTDAKSSSQPAWITHAGWSCDSEYVFAASTKRGLVNVYKLRDESWNATIEAGAEGLAKVEWAPDGRSILCFSEWGVRRYHCMYGRLNDDLHLSLESPFGRS